MMLTCSASVIETRLDDELVLAQIDNGTFHSLRSTGLAIWELIDGSRDAESIIDLLAARYGIARERCAADVGRFLDQIAAAGLIEQR